MENNKLIKNNQTGTTMSSKGAEAADLLSNNTDELQQLEITGPGHLPAGGAAMGIVIHKAGTRGHANHGWLDSKQSFSFADYYNPGRMHFGVLRVLNDDVVDPGMGFGRHPHDNMEIISIPLEGTLEHTDSMNNVAVIQPGDIQAMSAGTGIFHTEYNKSSEQPARFLQIWLFPKRKNTPPRYGQVSLNVNDRHNKLQQVVSPNPGEEGVWINQDAWFHLGRFDKGFSISYQLKNPTNGVYAFIITGDITIAGNILNERDGAGIWNTNEIGLKANSQGAEILLMEVPMGI